TGRHARGHRGALHLRDPRHHVQPCRRRDVWRARPADPVRLVATQAATQPSIGAAEISRPARSLWKDAWFTFTRDRLPTAGFVVFFVLLLPPLCVPCGAPGLCTI